MGSRVTTFEERQTVDIREAARILGIGRNTCYEGVRSGQIPHVRVGKRILVPRPALEKMLGGQTAQKA